MALQITAAVLHGPGDLRLDQRTIQPPEPNDVQVRIKATGLCGSDLHYYNHGRVGNFVLEEPMALGHEAAGIVTALGSDVTSLEIGDKVALEVGQPCERCERCVEGRYNLCKGMKFRASAKSKPVYQGTLQERLNAPARWCHKLPDDMPLALGALLEPLSVALHAVRRAQLPESSTVVIFGAGAVGLLTAAMAKAHHALSVVIADIDAARLYFAMNNGFADTTFFISSGSASTDEEALAIAKDTAEKIRDLDEPIGTPLNEVDAVFECTGAPSCVQAGIYTLRPGGKLMLIGIGTPSYHVPMAAAALREVDILGVFRYANTYPSAIEIMQKTSAQLPDLRKLVTHRFKFLAEAHKALETASSTKDEDGKPVLKVMLEKT